MRYAVVIPTVGRPSLAPLVNALGSGGGPHPDEVLIINDRPGAPVRVGVPAPLGGRLRILDGPGRGPAAARNVGWRAASAPWIVFLDDDVVIGPRWKRDLARDLADADGAAAVQATMSVPTPVDRRPTDWERQVSGLATAAWITADIAYRRDVLAEAGGFDERFPAAYREDVDLALRTILHGHTLRRGTRTTVHPVWPAGRWVSVARQRGNADDALLRRRYGRHWRRLAASPPGRRAGHVATTAAALGGLGAFAVGHRRLAATALAMWALATLEFAVARIRPGPRTASEIVTMALTSAVIPPLATAHWLRGWIVHRDVTRLPILASSGDPP